MFVRLSVAVLCAVVCVDAIRVLRSDVVDVATSEITNSTAKECCYPRPPRQRNMKRCCELPLDDIFDHLQEEIKQCKEEMKKKKDEQPVETSSTTAAPSTPPAKEEMEEADLVDLEDSTSNEVEDSPTTTTTTLATPTKTRQLHGRHHGGKSHGKKGPKGRCVKAIMEKRAWAKDGVVNYDAILAATEKPVKPEVGKWIPIIRDAVTNCSKQPLPEFKEGEKHHYVPEKAAYRCIKNNAMMNCPDFPENDSYCVELREVYQRCGARKQPGRRRFEWCDSNKHKSTFVA